MANHIIALNTTEESIYQKYLSATGATEAQIMASLKTVLTNQVLQKINEFGHDKFTNLSVADKIAFLES